MNDFVIIPDSSCDLTADLRKRFDIPDYLHGTVYFPDGRTEQADLDWGVISPEDFYKSMGGRNALYKTSTFTEQEGYEIYEK
jgi:fatty acid-binding protein DegV